MKISKELFTKYLQVQTEGLYNMNSKQALNAVGCTYEKFRYIQIHYKELNQQFPNLRKEIEINILNNLKSNF